MILPILLIPSILPDSLCTIGHYAEYHVENLQAAIAKAEGKS